MAPLRTSQKVLFLSLSAPHHPLNDKTLSRWLMDLLDMSGIDTKRFKSLSTRGAAATLWRDRSLSLAQILSRADWSSRYGIYEKFYCSLVARV